MCGIFQQEYSEEELMKMNLVRVNEDFRVIALGLPSPPYQGHPLDPPLRSRFQARDVSSLPFKVSNCIAFNQTKMSVSLIR